MHVSLLIQIKAQSTIAIASLLTTVGCSFCSSRYRFLWDGRAAIPVMVTRLHLCMMVLPQSDTMNIPAMSPGRRNYLGIQKVSFLLPKMFCKSNHWLFSTCENPPYPSGVAESLCYSPLLALVEVLPLF